MSSRFFTLAYNDALNEVPYSGRGMSKLALTDCVARKYGTKLRLAICSRPFSFKAAILSFSSYISLKEQFGLARRSGTFPKRPGVRSTKGFWVSFAECPVLKYGYKLNINLCSLQKPYSGFYTLKINEVFYWVLDNKQIPL